MVDCQTRQELLNNGESLDFLTETKLIRESQWQGALFKFQEFNLAMNTTPILTSINS